MFRAIILIVGVIAFSSTANAQSRCCFQLPSCSYSQGKCDSSNSDCCNSGCRVCKIKIKRNIFGAPAPASGMILSSVPAVTVASPAVPVTFGQPAAGAASASDLVALMKLLNEANSANAAADKQCPDPCGSLKQLESDVAALQQDMQNVIDAIELLVDERNARNQSN